MRNEIAKVIKQDQVMELFYGNTSNPKEILGRHIIDEGQVISAYHPAAVEMTLIDDHGKRYKMDAVEKMPVYSVFLPTLRTFPYEFEMKFEDGNTYVTADPYSFSSRITEEEEERFLAGEWYNINNKLGAHPMTIDGVEGTYFAVWAPNARRVSIVGDFNFWNGMMYPMQRKDKSGIFELFLPNVREKALYKFELKTLEGKVFQKIDPFGCVDLDGYGDTSIVLNITKFHWDDSQWMKDRRQKKWSERPFAVFDRKLADVSHEEFLENGYFTHVLMKAPTYGHGIRGKIRERINELHKKGIGVLLEVSLGVFSPEDIGLKMFDGTSLYGHADDRIRYDIERGMSRFNHGKKQVANYLISNLIFWIKEYHIDGFLFEGITEMMHPSFDNFAGGRREKQVFYQRDTEKFLQQAVEAVKKEDSSVLVFADEKEEKLTREEPNIYSKADFDGLLNYSIPANFIDYLQAAKEDTHKYFYKLSLPLMKSGLSDMMLNISLGESIASKDDLPQNIFGNEYDRLSWRKLTMGFFMGIPGKKRWTWQCKEPVSIKEYVKKLFEIYNGYSCMYSSDSDFPSFAWINGMDAESRVMTFVRRSPGSGKNLLFVCNFCVKRKEGFYVGVPKFGDYKLILNSAWEEFGGSVRDDSVVYHSISKGWDLQPYSLRLSIPAISILIFEY